jgi:uncharacterized protein
MSDPNEHPPQPFMNPYLAGFGLGLALLASFVVMGWGLGASSAFATCASSCVSSVAPDYAAGNAFFAEYAGNPLHDWLTWEVLGAIVGGLVSGLIANRSRLTVEHGPRWNPPKRLLLAFVGGMVMAAGAKIGGGCTSGQALTGGALLNLGSWVFMFSVFGGGYAVAWFFRKQWV